MFGSLISKRPDKLEYLNQLKEKGGGRLRFAVSVIS